jgi:hypothetical protein
VATIHLWVMVTATALFALTWLAQLDGYKDDEVRVLALALGLAAFAFLALGGIIGGANVFVYGIRVLKAEDAPPREALNPFGVDQQKPPGASRTHALAPAKTRVPATTCRRNDRPSGCAANAGMAPHWHLGDADAACRSRQKDAICEGFVRGERPDSNRRPPGPQLDGAGYAGSDWALAVGVGPSEVT